MIRKLILGTLAGLAYIGAAFAQTVPTPAPYSGAEQLRCTTAAGSACNMLMNHVRNTLGYLLVSTGTTVNSTPTWYQASVVATGAITTWGITLPNPAPDGMIFSISNSTASAFTTNTTVTAASTPQTHTLAVAYASQTLAANGGRAIWQYVATSTTAGTWYRIQ